MTTSSDNVAHNVITIDYSRILESIGFVMFQFFLLIFVDSLILGARFLGFVDDDFLWMAAFFHLPWLLIVFLLHKFYESWFLLSKRYIFDGQASVVKLQQDKYVFALRLRPFLSEIRTVTREHDLKFFTLKKRIIPESSYGVRGLISVEYEVR